MDVNTIQEIIKTINFSGEFNSETLAEVTRLILPYLYVLEIKSFMVNLLWSIAVVVAGVSISKAIIKKVEEE